MRESAAARRDRGGSAGAAPRRYLRAPLRVPQPRGATGGGQGGAPRLVVSSGVLPGKLGASPATALPQPGPPRAEARGGGLRGDPGRPPPPRRHPQRAPAASPESRASPPPAPAGAALFSPPAPDRCMCFCHRASFQEARQGKVWKKLIPPGSCWLWEPSSVTFDTLPRTRGPGCRKLSPRRRRGEPRRDGRTRAAAARTLAIKKIIKNVVKKNK